MKLWNHCRLPDPQLEWLGAVIELDHPVAGKRLYPGVPFRLSGCPPLQSTPAPLLGQHTEEICRDLLGMSEDEIKQLIDEDILHNPESAKGAGGGMFG